MSEKFKVQIPVAVFFLLVFISFFFPSCNKKDTFDPDYHYDYAPIDSGHYVIYDVDSITYWFDDLADTMVIDTIRYQLMELVGDTVDFSDEVHYELNLFRRADENSPWVYDRKNQVKRTATNFQKKEEDIWFVKMIFPPAEDAEWNGNIYVPTTLPYKEYLDWDYHYESVQVPFSINGFNFPSTITVSEVDNEIVISKILRKEVYAKGVGMVYQEWESLTNVQNQPLPNGNWETGIIQGWRIRMKVHSYYP